MSLPADVPSRTAPTAPAFSSKPSQCRALQVRLQRQFAAIDELASDPFRILAGNIKIHTVGHRLKAVKIEGASKVMVRERLLRRTKRVCRTKSCRSQSHA